MHKFRIQSESLYSHQPVPPFATFLFLDFDNLLCGFVFFGLRDYVIRPRVNRSKWLVNPSFNDVINAFAQFCFPINNSVMSRRSEKAHCSYVRRQHYVMLLQDIDCVYSVDSSKDAINPILSRLEWQNIIKRDRIKINKYHICVIAHSVVSKSFSCITLSVFCHFCLQPISSTSCLFEAKLVQLDGWMRRSAQVVYVYCVFSQCS